MFKKALLGVLLLGLTGCVGTVRIAEETVTPKDVNAPAVTKGTVKEKVE